LSAPTNLYATELTTPMRASRLATAGRNDEGKVSNVVRRYREVVPHPGRTPSIAMMATPALAVRIHRRELAAANACAGSAVDSTVERSSGCMWNGAPMFREAGPQRAGGDVDGCAFFFFFFFREEVGGL
jgi:hypothetical protein